MGELISRIGYIGHETTDAALDTARLAANPSVTLPHEHRYEGYFSDTLLDTFADFARAYHARVTDSPRDFPRAKILPAFQPAGVMRNHLPFLAVWGKRTEFPLPRTYLLPHYFGRVALIRARLQHAPIERLTLDATGLVGYFHETEDGVTARIAHGIHCGSIAFIDYKNITPVNAVEVLSQSLAEQQHAKPLVFRAGIKYHGNNGYVANVFTAHSHHALFLPRF
ncbi:MAG TPA: hypothetical protein VFN56_04645 [Candidatus Saccharimonadales bacterium]|nr:hypothetical protein [Candidatus Saccharimonadales bacterium]